MRVFQNYHRHSHYTNPRIADSVVRNEDYAHRAVELGHGLISSCEHGFQGRHIEGYKLGKEFNLKYMMSAEAYWVKDRFEKDSTNCHIFIGAMNEHGRQELNEILSEANVTGFYGRPRIDQGLIMSLPPEDVLVTTACIAGWKYPDMDEFVKDMAGHFRHFFLEVQYHNTPSQRALNRHILELHNSLRIPLIMGCDSHYIFLKDAQERDDYLVSKNIHYDEEEGWYLDYPDGDTAYDRFAEQCVLSHSDIVDAIDNTNVCLDVEEYDSPVYDDEIKMPSAFEGWTQEQKDAEYDRLIWAGWDQYKSSVPLEKHGLYIDEIQKEISTVHETKTSDYFLINHRVIQKGIENGGCLTKTGRGSAVSFFTNMLLGFTEVDRIAAKVKMYPDRFMSATRILQSRSLPDIDFNVADPEPFALAQEQVLGEDHAYPMIAYGTMKKSSAWKMYAKSQNVDFEIANEVSQQIKKYENALKHAEDDEKDDIDPLDYIDPQYHEIFNKSVDYQGLISSWSIAPCAYLLYPYSIRRDVGLVRVGDKICCLMDGKWAEEGHFLKNDLLRVRVVDLIYRTYRRIGREPHSVNELLQLCAPDDPAWAIYKKQCLLGINQVEQPGTASRVAKYAPTNISELCAFVAAIRPGFKTMYKVFESREPFSYNVPSFDRLIQTAEMPHSFLLYQETVMAAMNYAGIGMSEAYTCIKAISKKRYSKVLSYKEQFIKGFSERLVQNEGLTPAAAGDTARRIWQILEDSSQYSFNASHAYCVALDSLYGAWLKAHHPLEYYETYLRIQNEKKNKDKMSAGRAEAESYFKIRFPAMRYGQDNRQITMDKEKWQITNAMTSIKGFGELPAKMLFEKSEAGETSLVHILAYLAEGSVKAKTTMQLAKISYFSPIVKDKIAFHLIDRMEACDYCRAASYARAYVDRDPELRKIIERYCDGKTKSGSDASRYSVVYPDFELDKKKKREVNAKIKEASSEKEKNDFMLERRTIEDAIAQKIFQVNVRIWTEYEDLAKKTPVDDIDMRTKIQNQLEILGTVDFTTNKDEDRRKLIVLDVVPLGKESIWGYAVHTKSIGSGKIGRFTLRAWQMQKQPIVKHDVVYADNAAPNDKGYWYLNEYHLIY